jgi:hypothetical protein
VQQEQDAERLTNRQDYVPIANSLEIPLSGKDIAPRLEALEHPL